MNRPDVNRHPCFNESAKGTCARVHLPVARDCNIKCNYCNRKYDCVNESRPGITSAVLDPRQALRYLDEVMQRFPNITVAGIAGPGDAFADPARTLETIRLVRESYPDLLLCLATNGLSLEPYVAELAELGVSHVTVTVNAIEPEIGGRIYAWVRDGKVIYRGRKAAELLLGRQMSAIEALKSAGIVVKVNTIVIRGINDDHVVDVSRRISELGVDIQNCMVMFPNAGTPFQDIPEVSPEQIASIRRQAQIFIPQMKHCVRCRADAVGLLEKDRSSELRNSLVGCSLSCGTSAGERPYVAVATLEGALVNLHLGEAPEFQIWGKDDTKYRLMDVRPAPEPGTGNLRWIELAALLRDCRAVLVAGVGENPRKILLEHDIFPVEMNGLIEAGLDAIYGGHDPATLRGRRKGARCARSAGCGDGGGCG